MSGRRAVKPALKLAEPQRHDKPCQDQAANEGRQTPLPALQAGNEHGPDSPGSAATAQVWGPIRQCLQQAGASGPGQAQQAAAALTPLLPPQDEAVVAELVQMLLGQLQSRQVLVHQAACHSLMWQLLAHAIEDMSEVLCCLGGCQPFAPLP